MAPNCGDWQLSAIGVVPMKMIIPTTAIEFEVGGNTIHITSRHGMPLFKIICSGSISLHEDKGNFRTECEIRVPGNIVVSAAPSDAKGAE
jgi:hypothetical protein